jgi:Rrf2 family transcriptional regulator, nitric oxide-sensitive transcriptional repressor
MISGSEMTLKAEPKGKTKSGTRRASRKEMPQGACEAVSKHSTAKAVGKNAGNIFRISDAVSLGLHTMVLLAAGDSKTKTAHNIASTLNVSEAHLEKVMQRLGHSGLVLSARGPRGGFVLVSGGSDITLLDVYEAIAGPMGRAECLLDEPVCGGNCILGGLMGELNERVRSYLGGMRLSDARAIISKGCAQ